ncbi:C-type lectin domain family 4 member M-like [Pomacea canaliculata]|uniref:C-type lectin domain family 4 member M-like n=1 Tax=Pomacea canaliculata TaxID=400727 RepID=UPI000D73D5BB|nr:C-type lectin domain family 4 member M-like [Pomacea canaliculata]
MRLELRLKSVVPVTWMLLVTCTPVHSHCPDKWSAFGGKCYILSPSFQTWSESFKACGKIRGHFIKINSAAENDLVRQLISPNYTHWAWLPIHDLNKEGLWEQAKSKKPLVYHNWAVGEPNQNGDEDCGAMAADGLWNDLSCDLFLPAVCQRGIIKM